MTTLHHHAHLQRELRAVESRLKAIDCPLPDPHGDDADRLVAREAHEVQVLSRAALLERQGLILVALDKIQAGTYGQCETCGYPIEAKRLAATPEVRLCLVDQTRAERNARRMGPRLDMTSDDEAYL